MSDEEKEILNKLKEYMQDSIDKGHHKFFYNDLGWDFKCIDCINAIDVVLEEIEELKDKDKEHKQRITYLENKIFNQKQTIKNGINVKKLDVNSLCKNFNLISKDKIKAKIEELENEHTGCTQNVFSVLESLLEKE